MKRNLALIIVLISFCSVVSAQTAISKAQSMFIYNFSRLIEWPAEYKTGEFVIGVVGSAPIYDELLGYTTSKKVGAQSISVSNYASESEIGKCHILFVPFNKTNKMDDIVSKVGNNSTLIVAEKKGGLEAGASINFLIIGNSLKFELSTENATKRGLTISSSLENMAVSN